MKEALRATWRNIPEDSILHSHRRENLKSYKVDCIFNAKGIIHHEFMPKNRL
jgi:hypothetical protein